MPKQFADDILWALSANITSTSATTFAVTSSTGAPDTTLGDFDIRIDNEYMIVTAGPPSSTTWTVTRGAYGSTAATHATSSLIRPVLTKEGFNQRFKDNVVVDIFSNRPASERSGKIFIPSDGFGFDIDNGSFFDSFYDNPITRPPLTGWSQVNFESCTTDNLGGSVNIYEPGPSTGGQENVRALERTPPSTPYTIIVRLEECMRAAGSFVSYGVGWRESSSGKLQMIMIQLNTIFQVVLYNFNSPTSFSGQQISIQNCTPNSARYMYIKDDGTNRSCGLSCDGVNLIPIGAAFGRTTFITPNKTLFGFDIAIANIPGLLRLVSWKEQ